MLRRAFSTNDAETLKAVEETEAIRDVSGAPSTTSAFVQKYYDVTVVTTEDTEAPSCSVTCDNVGADGDVIEQTSPSNCHTSGAVTTSADDVTEQTSSLFPAKFYKDDFVATSADDVTEQASPTFSVKYNNDDIVDTSAHDVTDHASSAFSAKYHNDDVIATSADDVIDHTSSAFSAKYYNDGVTSPDDVSPTSSLSLMTSPSSSSVMPPAQRRKLKTSTSVDHFAGAGGRGDDDDNSDVFNGFPSIVWDWPFSASGVARCSVVDNKFNVTLDFSYLEKARRVEVKRSENLKSDGFCWTIGLCAVGEHSDNTFWRLEIQVIRNLHLVLIEAYREMNRDTRTAKTVRKLRKMFQLPATFDINTLRTSLPPDRQGAILLEADKHKRQDAVPKRKA